MLTLAPVYSIMCKICRSVGHKKICILLGLIVQLFARVHLEYQIELS